jgi:integrase/recombinase XerD
VNRETSRNPKKQNIARQAILPVKKLKYFTGGIVMTKLRQKMLEDMQLRGMSAETQRAYVLAVKLLAKHYNRSPDQITEAELRAYLLYLRNEKQVSNSTFTVYLCGIKFFYEYTLKQTWPTLELARGGRERKLPSGVE